MLNPFIVGEVGRVVKSLMCSTSIFVKGDFMQNLVLTLYKDFSRQIRQSRFAPTWVYFTILSCFEFLNLLCGRKYKIYNVTFTARPICYCLPKTAHIYRRRSGYKLYTRRCKRAYFTENSFNSPGWYPVVRRPSVYKLHIFIFSRNFEFTGWV